MEFEKVNEFITQLTNSSSLKNLSTVEMEETINKLIDSKESKLKDTFSSKDYYPETPWSEIRGEMQNVINKEIVNIMKSKLQNILFYSIQNLVNFPKPDTTYREKIQSLVLKLVSRNSSRQAYGRILSFIESDALTTYIKAVYENRRKIYLGLARSDSNTLKTPEEAKDFFLAALLLMPMYDITLPAASITPPQYSYPKGGSVSLKQLENDNIMARNFILKIQEIITKEMPEIPPAFMNALGKAFYLDSGENPPYVSKVMKILYRLALEWKTIQKDKGADSLSLSFFSIAKVNYVYEGYDIGIIDELYNITLEEDI